ncbi:MAG: nuclear transport factor 2 family protein [Candidatus Eisenbacteria bacterium]|nr:nuclear transport factor 2 family protein [Candidatus Eisenbacteria bacterium]
MSGTRFLHGTRVRVAPIVPRSPHPRLHADRHQLILLLVALLATALALLLTASPAASKGCDPSTPAEVPRCWASALNNADWKLLDEMLSADFQQQVTGPSGAVALRDKDEFERSLAALLDPRQVVKFEATFSDSLVVTERSITRWRIDTVLSLTYLPRLADGSEGKAVKTSAPVSLFVQRAIEPAPHYELHRWETVSKAASPIL